NCARPGGMAAARVLPGRELNNRTRPIIRRRRLASCRLLTQFILEVARHLRDRRVADGKRVVAHEGEPSHGIAEGALRALLSPRGGVVELLKGDPLRPLQVVEMSVAKNLPEDDAAGVDDLQVA